MIELRGVSREFGAHKALDHVDLFIQEGEIFGIVGKSGAGKSTLLRTINLLEHPDCGEVWIDGEDITRQNRAGVQRIRHKMAMVFQHFNLLDACNVYDNIALPLRIQGMDEALIREKIDTLLPLVGLSDKALAHPAQLSGGQKQRVGIARALAGSPKILLCDEATSALDPETTDSILDLLRKINALYGITILLITHEMHVVRRICHRIGVMENGKLAEITPLARVFENPESLTYGLFYSALSPPLPACLAQSITGRANRTPLVRLFFQGTHATVPFISETSRELELDINILLANIERYDTMTCGVLVAELNADETLLHAFITRCEKSGLTVETLGYVDNTLL